MQVVLNKLKKIGNIKGILLLRDYIAERVINISNYIVNNKATVRQAAKCFGVSKSTVHQDVTKKLEKIDRGLAKQVRKVLDINKEERHIRGGLATKSKYQK
jgi:putative DeoR family transcriptional regulator (stage III sporulation protein D)